MVSCSEETRGIFCVYFLFQFCSLVLLNSSCEQMLFLIEYIIIFNPSLLSLRSFLAWQHLVYFFPVRNVPWLSPLCCTTELCFNLVKSRLTEESLFLQTAQSPAEHDVCVLNMLVDYVELNLFMLCYSADPWGFFLAKFLFHCNGAFKYLVATDPPLDKMNWFYLFVVEKSPSNLDCS